MHSKRIGAIASGVLLAGVLAACSSGGSGGGNNASGGGSIKVGFINEAAGSSGSYPEATAAAQAAVKYINAELNGVGGKKIDLDTCTTDGTLATSQRCAEQMVSDGVTYVQGGLDPNQQAWYSILKPAGIPVIGAIPETQTDYNAQGAYNFQGGTATVIPALAAYVHEFAPDIKSVGILTNDLPGAVGSLPLIQKPLSAWGVKSTVVKVPTTQSDWTAPYVQAAQGHKMILALLAGPNCQSLAQAASSQGNNVKIVAVGPCNSADVYKAIGNKENGWVIPGGTEDPQGSTPDAKLYQRVVKKYAGASANLSGFAPASFINVMTAYDSVLKPLAGKTIDAKSVTAQVTNPKGGKVFLAGTYKCPGSPFPAVCSYSMNYWTIQNQKLTKPTKFIDLAETLKLGGQA